MYIIFQACLHIGPSSSCLGIVRRYFYDSVGVMTQCKHSAPPPPTLTVDLHLVGVGHFADGVAQLTRVNSVVLLLQRLDHHRAHVGGERHAPTGSQRLAVFQPRRRRRVAGRGAAAEVGRAVSCEEEGGGAADFGACDGV